MLRLPDPGARLHATTAAGLTLTILVHRCIYMVSEVGSLCLFGTAI